MPPHASTFEISVLSYQNSKKLHKVLWKKSPSFPGCCDAFVNNRSNPNLLHRSRSMLPVDLFSTWEGSLTLPSTHSSCSNLRTNRFCSNSFDSSLQWGLLSQLSSHLCFQLRKAPWQIVCICCLKTMKKLPRACQWPRVWSYCRLSYYCSW